ncbi:MAG: DUF2155 domain-containing protein [Geminicoccaceae bacterium]|nr:DUF2155 domain-containing protein [Geminicoccaceae bacterium]
MTGALRRSWVASACVLALVASPALGRPSEPHRVAVLRALDKVTARVSTLEAPVDATTRFGTLLVTPRACLVAPPIDPPERAAFLEIREIDRRSGRELLRFSGWMFASSPGLSALEHPIYDVWLLDCREPVAPEPAAPASPPIRR